MKTPCQKLGYKVGDKFEIIQENNDGFSVGTVVSLCKDDGTDMPLFAGENTKFRNAYEEEGAYTRLANVRPLKPKKAKRPWIKWDGGECPVPEGTLIDVKHRDGEKFKCSTARLFDWKHMANAGDIVAYRLAKPKKAAEPAKPEWEILWGSEKDFEEAPDWAMYVLGENAFVEDVIKGSRLRYGPNGPEDVVKGLANTKPKAARRLKQPK